VTKKQKHINVISCGQGAPSVYLIVAAGMGIFPCDVVIVADTGWENDMLWDNGRRTDAKTFFQEVTKPLAEEFGFEAHFVRSVDESKNPLPPLSDHNAMLIHVPFFGDRGGRRSQSCTDKWKIRAIRQQLRRMGAETATTHLGITMDEVHRVKRSNVKWEQKEYPLVYPQYNHRKYKAEIVGILKKMGVNYLVSSECDGCPHKDLWRWKRTSPDTLAELEKIEKDLIENEGLYFTSNLIPLNDSIELMTTKKGERTLFDVCDSGYCFT